MRSLHIAAGYVFLFMGTLATVTAGTAVLIQRFVTGEAMVTVTSNGHVQRAKQPLGIEFACVPLALGMGFAGIGRGLSAATPRARALGFAFGVANLVMVPVTFAAVFVSALHGDAGSWLYLGWPIVIGLGLSLATRRVGYRHADAMEQLAVKANIAAAPDTLESTDEPSFSSAVDPTRPQGAEKPSAIVWIRALALGALAGSVPIVFFSATILPALVRQNNHALPFFIVFIGVAALIFGGIATLAALLAQRAAGGTTPTDAARAFAGRVQGQVTTQTLLWGIVMPKGVSFNHRGMPAVLDCTSQWGGAKNGDVYSDDDPAVASDGVLLSCRSARTHEHVGNTAGSTGRPGRLGCLR